MNLNLVFILLASLFTTVIKAQTDYAPVNISGRMSAKFLAEKGSSSIRFDVYNTFIDMVSPSATYVVEIGDDGSFNTTIDAPDSLFYMSISHQPRENKSFWPIFDQVNTLYMTNVLLFEAGDSIRMSLLGDNMHLIKGRGADKLKCQLDFMKSEVAPKNMVGAKIRLINQKKYEQAELFVDHIRSLSVERGLLMLETYREQIGEAVYQRLKVDFIAYGEYPQIRRLTALLYGNERMSEYRVPAVKKYFDYYLQTRNELPGDSLVIAQSAYYAHLLFQKEANKLRFNDGGSHMEEGRVEPSELVRRFQQQYHGELLEKLLLITLCEYEDRDYQGVMAILPQVQRIVRTPVYKEALDNWVAHQYHAYPFELEDANGTIHRLADYKGKLVVAEFWYTGCLGCIFLHAAMQPVMEKYRGREDIIFVTISIDRSKETWIKSLSENKYSSPNTINLYTGGTGANHPMIEFYGYRSYPNLLLIGKEGEIITKTPPRPHIKKGVTLERSTVGGTFYKGIDASEMSESSHDFIKLVDDYLSKEKSS